MLTHAVRCQHLTPSHDASRYHSLDIDTFDITHEARRLFSGSIPVRLLRISQPALIPSPVFTPASKSQTSALFSPQNLKSPPTSQSRLHKHLFLHLRYHQSSSPQRRMHSRVWRRTEEVSRHLHVRDHAKRRTGLEHCGRGEQGRMICRRPSKCDDRVGKPSQRGCRLL